MADPDDLSRGDAHAGDAAADISTDDWRGEGALGDGPKKDGPKNDGLKNDSPVGDAPSEAATPDMPTQDLPPTPDTGPTGPCGGTWTTINTGLVSANLRGVYCTSPFAVYAVGDMGRIHKFDGFTWNVVHEYPKHHNLKAIFGVVGQLFAVGVNDTILESNSNWSPQGGTTTGTFHGVWGANPNAYVVGSVGRMLHKDLSGTGAWKAYDTLTPGYTLRGVWGTGSKVYVVGGTTMDGQIWLTTGSGLNPDHGPTKPLYDIHGTGPNNIVAVGSSGQVFRFNGASWQQEGVGVTPQVLYGVWGSGANNVFFAVGGGKPGTILCHDGTKWVSQQNLSTAYLSDVWGCGGDVFAVGPSGNALRYKIP